MCAAAATLKLRLTCMCVCVSVCATVEHGVDGTSFCCPMEIWSTPFLRNSYYSKSHMKDASMRPNNTHTHIHSSIKTVIDFAQTNGNQNYAVMSI